MSAYPNPTFGQLPNAAVQDSPAGLSFTHAALALPGSSGALTVPQLVNGLLTAATGGLTFTLPTAAALVSALGGSIVGTSLELTVVNTSGSATTLAAGTGGSGLGSLVVAGGASGKFRVRLTNVSSGSQAYQLQRLS